MLGLDKLFPKPQIAAGLIFVVGCTVLAYTINDGESDVAFCSCRSSLVMRAPHPTPPPHAHTHPTPPPPAPPHPAPPTLQHTAPCVQTTCP